MGSPSWQNMEGPRHRNGVLLSHSFHKNVLSPFLQAMWLAKHLSTNLLSVEGLIAKEYSPLAADARMHYQKFKVG